MTETYRVAVLNLPLRVFGLSLPQIIILPMAIGVQMLFAVRLSHDIHFLGIPLSALVFTFLMSVTLALSKMTTIKPLHWWARYLKYRVDKKIPFSFPEVAISHQSHRAMRISKSDFVNLDSGQQRQMLDLMTDFAGKPGNSLQIFSPSLALTGGKFEREFYVISDCAQYAQNDLKEKLERSHLPTRTVDEESIRKLMFAYLSPGHATAEMPSILPYTNDLLTLCASGFEQHKDHITIDGKYVSSFYIQTLPPQSYFGFLNRLMEVDINLSLSTFVKATTVANVRKVIELNYCIQKVGADPPVSTQSRSVFGEVAKVAAGQIAAVQLSVYLTLYAESRDELTARTITLQSFIDTFGGTLSPATVQEFDALMTVLPLNKDLIGCTHLVVPLTAQTYFPFT